MKPFKTTIEGIEVTDSNILAMCGEISSKYGICPKLNTLVHTIAINLESFDNTQKGYEKSTKEAIKLVGYNPAYYKKLAQMTPTTI